MSMQLAGKLGEFHSTLDVAEQATFKLLLGLAAGGLMPGYERPREALAKDAIDTVTDALAHLQPYHRRISPNGIAFRGVPPFLSPHLLDSLCAEASARRPEALPFDEHFLGCGGAIADQLAQSPQMLEFVRQHAGEVRATGVASYLFYEEGQGIKPHIDTDIFSLNVLIMLQHNNATDGSALVVFPPRQPPERIVLSPGQMVIMFAGSITHARERLKPGESVTILTLGFHPLGE